jgi:NADPH:quinone reductase
VTRWRIGDQVCALTAGGGYAQYCVARHDHCLPIPHAFGLKEAAALPEGAFTVWTNVFDRCKLAEREHFLVHAGASGIGYLAIQMAKAMGATVYTTAGGADKVEFCKQLGADYVFNHLVEDWVAAIGQITNKRGVDVVLDMVGGDYVAKNLRVMAVEGRMAFIAFLRGGQQAELTALDLRQLMMKRLTRTGSTLRPRSDQDKAWIARRLEAQILPHVAAGRIHMHIHKVFPLDQVQAAHELMESNRHVGKILLDCRG